MKKLLLLFSAVLLALSCSLGASVASAKTRVYVDVGRSHYYPHHRHSHYRKPSWQRHYRHHHRHSRYY